MTRKTQVVTTAVAALTVLAAGTAFWLTRDRKPTDEEKPAPVHAAHTAPPESSQDTHVDPAVMAEVRQAFRSSLAEGASPGMLELMPGSGSSGSADLPPLPPLPDPNVAPARYNSEPSPDLPPLPSSHPEMLPPPMESPATQTKVPEAAPGDLPPLPPVPPVKSPR